MIGGTVIIAIAIGPEIAKVSEKVASLAFGIATAVLALSLTIRGVSTANRLNLLRDQVVDLTLLLRSLLKSETQPSKAREEHHGSFESPFTGRKCNKQQKRC